MAKVIAVLQQKGGVGKSTVAVNLAGEFDHSRKRTFLIDADPQQTIVEDWASSAAESSTLARITRSGEDPEGGNPLDYLHHVIDRASREAEIIVIDTPPSFDARAAVAAIRADLALIPCGPGRSDIRTAVGMIDAIKEAREQAGLGGCKAAIIPNRVKRATVLGRTLLNQLDDFGEIIMRPVSERIANTEAAYHGKTTREYGADELATKEWDILRKQTEKLL